MDPPTFRELCDRYASDELIGHISLHLDDFEDHPEAQSVLQYLSSFGFRIETADDLFHAINALENEDELTAFRCREGVAVSHASDGWWLLFEDTTIGAPK